MVDIPTPAVLVSVVHPKNPTTHPTADTIGGSGSAALGSGRIVGAIPARYASTRLPGKPLRLIAGKPMIEHVYRRAAQADGIDSVVVLTDDARIAEAVDAFGGRCEMTPADCASGTDRIAHAARGWTDVVAVINIQGDEPLIEPDGIARLARHLREHPDDGMATLAAPAADGELEDPNAVKVVVDLAGYALYFSRASIPFPRRSGAAPTRKHVGIYAYRREVLLRLAELAPTALEQAESLEQLRALEHGIRIRVLDTERAAPGVDTEEDLARVELALQRAARDETIRDETTRDETIRDETK